MLSKSLSRAGTLLLLQDCKATLESQAARNFRKSGARNFRQSGAAAPLAACPSAAWTGLGAGRREFHASSLRRFSHSSVLPASDAANGSNSGAKTNGSNSDVNGSNATLGARIAEVSVDAEARTVEIQWRDGPPSTFHMVWLRDHDRSPATVDEHHQRTIDSGAIPLDMEAVTVTSSPEGSHLHIKWLQEVAGVQESTFDAEWLKRHCFFSRLRSSQSQEQSETWGVEMCERLPSLAVPYDQVMGSDAALLQLLQNTARCGLGVVSETPHDSKSSRIAAERIGPIRHTFYGGWWETKVLPEGHEANIDSAYSTVALPPHTDGNYWEDPPGLQIFFCLQADPKGGDTVLVDGFRIAEAVKAKDPEAFEVLCTTPLAFQHKDPENHVVAIHHVFGTDASGRVTRVHINGLDRDTLLLPPAQIPAFYRAWRCLQDVMWDPAHQVVVKLVPGDLLVINNRRVLHGRTAFNSSSGRSLVGGYISYEDFTSKLRVLEARSQKGVLA
mmetsp:Transcript_52685/g.125450  ORF Transcript_52685/g.125450 Transcript_52685/m.125450 type:complete len:500 (+) Transcript_52685:114-1613(+)